MAIRHSRGVGGKGIALFGQARLWGFAGCVSIAGVMLAGCATTTAGVTAESPQDVKQKVVKERALARWQAVIKGDGDKAYEFLSPGSKAVTSIGEYKGRARLNGFQSADVTSAVCEADTCKVRATVVLEHKMMKRIPIELEESWELEKGQYWYVWRP